MNSSCEESSEHVDIVDSEHKQHFKCHIIINKL